MSDKSDDQAAAGKGTKSRSSMPLADRAVLQCVFNAIQRAKRGENDAKAK